MYLHWSKKIAMGLLAGFDIGVLVSILAVNGADTSPTIIWITLNYVGLLVWLFIWIADQARVRGRNIWLWLVPTVLAPLPTLMWFLISLQKRVS